jgi:uncharacterized cupin superfamily protein
MHLPVTVTPKSIVITTPATLEHGATTQSVLPRWVLSGTPVTRTWNVVRSHDLNSDIVVWECTAGRFECRYSVDETVMVVAGEVFITDQGGEERRLGPGDLGFFPAGSSCIWRVPASVRKIAVLRETMWRPVGLGLKVWKRLLGIVGIPRVRPAAAAKKRSASAAG